MNRNYSYRADVLFGGLLCFLLAAMFTGIEPYMSQVYTWVIRGIASGDSGQLILAAALYVGLRTLLLLPLVMAGMLWGQAAVAGTGRPLIRLPVILLVVTAPLSGVAWWEGDRVDLAAPLLAVLIGTWLVAGVGRGGLHWLTRAVVLAEIMLGVFWLEVTPVLSPAGFGRGDAPTSIKVVAEYLQAVDVFDFVGLGFFFPFLLIGVITTRLAVDYDRRLEVMHQAKEREQELQRVRLAAVETRAIQEMHSLVHDLKTPLTTVQGLNSILEMLVVEDRQREYCQRIGAAVDHMNAMISEILYDDYRQDTDVGELIKYAWAQLLPEKTNQQMVLDIPAGLPRLRLNRVRVARALINITQNALNATAGHPDGRVSLSVRPVRGGVDFIVEDNGVGILPGDLPRIWEIGYSTQNTSGLGLPFVQRVVAVHGGTVEVDSGPGIGTRVKIHLPEG